MKRDSIARAARPQPAGDRMVPFFCPSATTNEGNELEGNAFLASHSSLPPSRQHEHETERLDARGRMQARRPSIVQCMIRCAMNCASRVVKWSRVKGKAAVDQSHITRERMGNVRKESKKEG